MKFTGIMQKCFTVPIESKAHKFPAPNKRCMLCDLLVVCSKLGGEKLVKLDTGEATLCKRLTGKDVNQRINAMLRVRAMEFLLILMIVAKGIAYTDTIG